MDINQQRRRSNALHADSSEEYLEKLELQDCVKPSTLKLYQSMSLDYSPAQLYFDLEDRIELEAEDQQNTEGVVLQQYHRVLVISDDFELSHLKINEMFESTNDSMSESTSDESKSNVGRQDEVFPLDIYLTKRIIGQTQHIFQFWIQNSFKSPLLQLFEQTYYQQFEAFIHCTEPTTNESVDIQEVKQKLLGCDTGVKFFELLRTNDCYQTENFSTSQAGSFTQIINTMLVYI